MSNSHRVIYVAANQGQAHALKNLLADHGIAAFVSNDTLNAVHFALGDVFIRGMGAPGFYDTAPLVVVLEEDAEEARQIALEAESAWQQGLPSPELARLEEEIGEDEWPLCPDCKRPRLASCPVCETAGTHFAEAFLPETEAESDGDQGDSPKPLLVICPTCDEPFAPQFPARCEWCGHRFPDGYEPPPVNLLSTPPVWAPAADLAVMTVIVGLLVVVAAVFGWFYYILR